MRSAPPGSEEALKAIGHAEGVASILRHNIVQGKKVEGKDALGGCRKQTEPHLFVRQLRSC